MAGQGRHVLLAAEISLADGPNWDHALAGSHVYRSGGDSPAHWEALRWQCHIRVGILNPAAMMERNLHAAPTQRQTSRRMLGILHPGGLRLTNVIETRSARKPVVTAKLLMTRSHASFRSQQ